MYEREADSLGLLYLYRTGYDPVSFIDFFERIQSKERKESGLLPRFLGTHPMTASRIKAAQRQIERSFAPKSEYLINTSEFDDIHARLIRLHNHQRIDFSGNSTLPRLAHRPGEGTRDGAVGNQDPGGPPTLKRGTPQN